jgi:hypothetical protein
VHINEYPLAKNVFLNELLDKNILNKITMIGYQFINNCTLAYNEKNKDLVTLFNTITELVSLFDGIIPQENRHEIYAKLDPDSRFTSTYSNVVNNNILLHVVHSQNKPLGVSFDENQYLINICHILGFYQ